MHSCRILPSPHTVSELWLVGYKSIIITGKVHYYNYYNQYKQWLRGLVTTVSSMRKVWQIIKNMRRYTNES